MTFGTFIIIVLAIALIVLSWRRRRRKINAMWLENEGTNIVGRWQYSPEEWKEFSEDHFTWVKNKDVPGELIISDDSILISNGLDELFWDISGKWTLDNIEFREALSVFDIRLRGSRRNRLLDTYETVYEDVWIPLPSGNPEKARRVVEHFQENEREMKENLNGATTNDLLFSRFLNSEPAENEDSENV